MVALHKELHVDMHVDMVGTALLAFEAPVYGIHPAKHASHRGCVAAKHVHAGLIGMGAIGAIPAIPHPEDVTQHQQHEGLEAFRTCQRVPGKQCFALIVRQQLLAGRRANAGDHM